MNNLGKSIVAAMAVTLCSSAARATVDNGDFVLGFTSASASQDYVVDLGNLGSVSTITHLGNLVNLGTLNSTITSGMQVGLVFGNVIGGTGDYVGLSTLRTGNNDLGVMGAEGAPASPSGGNFVSGAATMAVSLAIGTPNNTDQSSFSYASSSQTGSFASSIGINPSQAMSGQTISLDIFESTRLAKSGRNTPASPYSYMGQLEIDLSGSSAVVDYIPAGYSVVPEPTTLGLLAGMGMLALTVRRSSRRA